MLVASLRTKILLATVSCLAIALLAVVLVKMYQKQKKSDDIAGYVHYQSYDFNDNFDPDSSSTSPDSDLITAQGTWDSESKNADPMSTHGITCLRTDHPEPYVHEDTFPSKGLCVISTAILRKSNHFFSSKTTFYDVTTWTDDVIIARGSESVYDCFSEVLTLDRQKQSVSLLRTKLPNADPAARCGFFWRDTPDSEEYTLGCGPSPWPVKTVLLGTMTDYCSPDFEHMTEEQRQLFNKIGQ